jgi:hypothetical protein
MPYRDINPTYNVNRKVANFGDFTSNIDAEKEKLKKVKRSFTPNSDKQQFVRNSRTEYNPVTHKLTDYTEDEVEDKIKAIEELEGTNEDIDGAFEIGDNEDKKIEIWNDIMEMTQRRHAPEFEKWLDNLSSEELEIIYKSIKRSFSL